MTPGEMAGRIEAAEGPNYALECEIEETFGVGRVPPPNVTYSLDAAVMFVERVLPGTIVTMQWGGVVMPMATLDPPASRFLGAHGDIMTHAKTPAMALVAAALRALQAAADGGAG